MGLSSYPRYFPSVDQNGDEHCWLNICAKTSQRSDDLDAMISVVFADLSACLRLAAAAALAVIVSVVPPFGAARATPQIDKAASL